MEQVLFEIKNLKSLIEEQNILQKKVLTFKEAAKFIDVSESHLYLLTSKSLIPHYKPNGKKIYFKKSDLDNYIFRNRKSSDSELEQKAVDYVTLNSNVVK